ncbi:DUF481 domain-containing protein [Desulfovibrio gilichinskyi]|uniref:Putative salt-induced outer membrane protein YdiY n=1 Tax=Desulfovibrio gilichinskyi TaxID=1519643 RepID=A0A1X7DLR3_9BACT|nr:DUF481 domain-containing protein [Desulfovibrio gilichinskyi]SMF17976.1 Putative salt-induced outer membrane protein YdiY [Desulfovibrio gilichinskyi]
MFFRIKIITFIFFMIIASTPSARADTIHLLNGDKLTGKIDVMTNGKLKLTTTYAGEIVIDWGQVLALDSDHKMKIYIKPDQKIETASSTKAELSRTIGHNKDIKTSEVAAINSIPKDYTFKGGIRAGVNKASGNTRKESIGASFDLAYTTGNNRWKTRGNHYWASSKGQRSDYNWLLSADYNRFLDKKIFVTGSGQIQQDQFQDLKLRSLVGTGLGYQFFDSKELALSVEAGPAYVWEDYSTNDSKDYLAGKWGINFNWWVFTDHLNLFHNQMGFISLENSKHWIWQSQSGIMFPIVKRFFGAFQYNYDWTNDPVPGKKQDDSRLMFNLGYSFADFPSLFD